MRLFLIILASNLIFCHDYYIKLPKEELYLQGIANVNALPYFGPREKRNTFSFQTSASSVFMKNIFVKEAPNQVIDLASENNKIVYYPFYGTKNQDVVFRMENGKNLFRIVMSEKCLTWHPDFKYVDAQICNKNNNNQRFVIECADCRENKFSNTDSFDAPNTDGFYDEKMMAMLEKISAMAKKANECFSNNGTCAKGSGVSSNNTNLCVSQFGDKLLSPLDNSDPKTVDLDDIPQKGRKYVEIEDINGKLHEAIEIEDSEGDIHHFVEVENDDGTTKFVDVGTQDLSYENHEESIKHDEELEREMEQEFNKESTKLENLLRKYVENSFTSLKNTSEGAARIEAEQKLSQNLLDEIRKMHNLPTYTDLFSKNPEREEARKKAEDKKFVNAVHNETKNIFNKLMEKIKEHQNEVKHQESEHENASTPEASENSVHSHPSKSEEVPEIKKTDDNTQKLKDHAHEANVNELHNLHDAVAAALSETGSASLSHSAQMTNSKSEDEDLHKITHAKKAKKKWNMGSSTQTKSTSSKSSKKEHVTKTSTNSSSLVSKKSKTSSSI
ncbi:hypothetical protein EDEG_02161 [Edhazardia aedis USNM 41457]|uniref:Ricin B lectin domain-containing protein n=1 Tax=Edhazardia aedis (strain USNM 41457) TaxID=1003232 RepID=J9DLN8_EDHAE|nr:hypothetical protein EDEG_02161 [Edhazardia aedis USNM 41457]|eukprot:EJW03505.1 hypothetical protein EDEG_02161 [Edhazardia aedis USNM 41457]